jgi:hypothetical protein
MERHAIFVRIANASQRNPRVRVGASHRNRRPLHGQVVPALKCFIRTIEQRGQCFSPPERIGQQRAREGVKGFVTPFAVGVRPLDTIEPDAPVGPLQLWSRRCGMSGDRHSAEPSHILGDISRLPAK